MILTKQHTRQPQTGHKLKAKYAKSEINWIGSSPSADGLTRGASLTNGAKHYGQIINFTGNTSNAYTRSGGTVAADVKCSFISVFTWNSGGANNYPQLIGLATDNKSFRLGAAASGGGDIGMTKGGVASLNTLSISSGVPYVLVSSHRTDTGEYYLLLKNLNTGAITSTTQTHTTISKTGNGTYAVGTARTDYTGAWNGDIALGFACLDFIPQSEGYELLNNPWSIYEDIKTHIPFVEIAVGEVAFPQSTLSLMGVGY